jgi:hypothetical protein
MKQIELTLEHREKLLEMCKELFPETELSFESDLAEDGMIDINISKPNNLELIHWFEFCMTYLQDKLKELKCFEYEMDSNLRLMECWYKSHPVDYLYKIFKKLKNAK